MVFVYCTYRTRREKREIWPADGTEPVHAGSYQCGQVESGPRKARPGRDCDGRSKFSLGISILVHVQYEKKKLKPPIVKPSCSFLKARINTPAKMPPAWLGKTPLPSSSPVPEICRQVLENPVSSAVAGRAVISNKMQWLEGIG